MYKYQAHQADIVVVGGGLAGVTAANAAYERGASVLVVDKSVVGHSGNTGINWGHSFITAELSADDGLAGARFLTLDCMGILDQDLAREVIRTQIRYRPRQMIEQGGNIFQRDDDGNVVGLFKGDVLAGSPDAHFTGSAQLLRKRNVPIYEHMMMLDILLGADGDAQAVVAVSLLDGSAHIFCGQSIILATGGYHWAKGVSAGSPESTGDAHAALLRRGMPFKDMEFPQYDFTGIRPFASKPDVDGGMFEIAYTFGVNGEVWQRFLDRSKRPFVRPSNAVSGEQKDSLGMFQDTMTAAAKQLYARRGTVGDGSGNGLIFNLVDIMDDPSQLPYPTYKGFINDVEHNMDFDFPDYCEVIANEYSSCGSPWVNPTTAESSIPHLYLVFVGISAMSTAFAWSMAVMAAIDATARLDGSKASPAARCQPAPARCQPATSAARSRPPASHGRPHGQPHGQPQGRGLSISQDELQQVLARAYRPLEPRPRRRQAKIRSTELFRQVQRCFYKGYGFLKSESAMKAALQELERIEAEDLPRVCCADSSLVFNRDWRLAMESRNILTCSAASLAAGLCRRESRSPFFRADYPKMDNQQFLCSLWTSLRPGGGWQVEKGDIVFSVMSAQEIAAALGPQDISSIGNGS